MCACVCVCDWIEYLNGARTYTIFCAKSVPVLAFRFLLVLMPLPLPLLSELLSLSTNRSRTKNPLNMCVVENVCYSLLQENRVFRPENICALSYHLEIRFGVKFTVYTLQGFM